jgi:hypothetical protein
VTLLPEVECELLRVARLPLPLPDDSPSGGRASARRRPSWSSAVVAAVAVFALAIGIAFMTTLNRARSGGPANRGPAQAAFPGAPHSQSQTGDYWTSSDLCPLAAANRYLPPRSGCVTALDADVAGDGSDLVLVYSRLTRTHPAHWSGQPASWAKMFVPDQAFLKIVRPGGDSVTTAIDGARTGTIVAAAHVNDNPGKELFIETSRISSGAYAVAYGFAGGRLVAAGPTLDYGGDSATKAGFNCLPGPPPRLVQRTFELNGPTIHGAWSEIDVTFAWHGPRLVRLARRPFTLHGLPSASKTDIGRGCTAGIGG